MPRGRPRGSKNVKKLERLPVETAGPAIESVAVEGEEQQLPETVTYCKIKLRNLRDQGFPASFTYDGLSYNIPENTEVDVMKEVADNLNDLLVKQYAFAPDPLRPGKNKKVVEARPRYMVQYLETYEKEV